MGRLILQLYALLCLIAIISALPNCVDVGPDDVHFCQRLTRRWYEIQKSIQDSKYPSLHPGVDNYDSRMEEINKEATNQLMTELKALNGLSTLASQVEPTVNDIYERTPAKSKPWWHYLQFW